MLLPEHDCAGFDSGEAALDDWLRTQALRGQVGGAARTYVVCSEERVAGYYALAPGALAREEAVGKVRRNMPDPVPAILLARLAVDRRFQGLGLGSSLLRDAALRALNAADIIGGRALIVHAISQEAKRFYQYFGFREATTAPMTLMVAFKDLEKTLEPAHAAKR